MWTGHVEVLWLIVLSEPICQVSLAQKPEMCKEKPLGDSSHQSENSQIPVCPAATPGIMEERQVIPIMICSSS